MNKEVKLNKPLYKIELYLLKIIPYLLMMCYFANTTLSYIGIDAPILSLLGGISIFPLIFLYISSYVFRFCAYHRVPLHYVLISNIIAYYDLCIGIPISNRSLYCMNFIILGVAIFVIIYLKFKVCQNH